MLRRFLRHLVVIHSLLLVVSVLFGDAFQPVALTLNSRSSSFLVKTTQQYYPSPSRSALSKSTTKRSSSSSQLNAAGAISPLISTAASQVGSVAVLAFVVLIHECGHYFAAKSFGMKVEEFSVGLGPKVLGFEAFGNEFNLRAIPFGGYVRFPENFNQTLASETQDRRVLLESRTESKFWRKVNNILTQGGYEERLQYLEAQQQKKEEKQKNNESAKEPFWKLLLFSKKQNNEEKETTATDDNNNGNNNEIEYYDDPDLLQNRPWPQRAVVIAGGVIFNILLAFSIFFSQISSVNGMNMPSFEAGARVSAMPSNNVAVAGLLVKDDIILAINGSPLTASGTPSISASQKGIANFIATIRQTPEGESIRLSVVKAGSQNAVDISVRPKSNGENPSIGAMLSPNYKGNKKVRGETVPESAKLATQYVRELIDDTARGLSEAVGNLLNSSNKKSPGGAQLSGPIGLIRSGSEIVATNQLTTILTFAAIISVNLAVMNSLPLPALDGGQMVFILAEAIIGRKVDQKLQESITSFAILLLLLVTLSTTLGDLQAIAFK